MNPSSKILRDPKLLRVENLEKRYAKVEAIKNMSFTLGRGRIVGLLGPNGSGKTTLIKLIAGLLAPNSGEILIEGENPGPFTKSVVSYLPDTTYLDEKMTPYQAMDFFEDFYSDFSRTRAVRMLESLSVDGSRRIENLSKGNREKVQLILVMSRKAKLYLLDEPIGGVDPATRDYILKTILQNYEEDATVLISTHLISDVEQILDEVLILDDGRLIAQEDVDTVREEKGMSIDSLFRQSFKWEDHTDVL